MIDIRTRAIESARLASYRSLARRAAEDLRVAAENRQQLITWAAHILDLPQGGSATPETILEDAVVSIGDRMAVEIDGLMFVLAGRACDTHLCVVMPPCERCGHIRYSRRIDGLESLGMWLGNQEAQHSCPDDAEDWLINQEVRQAEIDAHIKAREAAASKTTRLEKLLAEHPQPWFEDAVCNIVEGVLGLSAIKIQEVADREF